MKCNASRGSSRNRSDHTETPLSNSQRTIAEHPPFVDSFGDLAYGPDKRIAILWKHASVCLESNFYAFLQAVHELMNAALGVGKSDSENDGIQVELFFLGEAPKFYKHP
jgi:hypothetical protein